MKKTISLLLALILLLGTMIPAFAESGELFGAAPSFEEAAQEQAAQAAEEAPQIGNRVLSEEADDTQTPAAQDTATPEEPAAQDPAAEEPATEEPATEEPEKTPLELRSNGDVPVVMLGGDGNDLYDGDGKQLYTFPQIIAAFATGQEGVIPDGFDLKESFTTILKAYVKGILTFREEQFYDALEAEVRKLTAPIQMDENGDPRNNSGVSAHDKEANEKRMTTPNPNGPYNIVSYIFDYDWRRSPMEIADELDAFIEAVCEMTGKQQISLVGRCLGTNFVLAYLTKYGYKNRIRGLGLDVGMMHGQDALSESISGKFSTDGNAILRYLADMEITPDDWLKDLIIFMERAHIFDNINASVKAKIYAKTAKGVTSALAMSTLFTMPGFWTCVSNRDYDAAMNYVFGKDGSAKRQKYAGLIQKIEAYHHQVQLPMDDMLRQFAADGGKLALVVKYGYQLMPMCDSRNLAADSFVSVKNASLGATTSLNYNTLSEEYISSREALGLGKYISPDKKIDASTCMFPDYTWFIKNIEHATYIQKEYELLYTVITGDEQYTVDDFDCTQFLVKEKDATTNTPVPMTAENSATENWETVADTTPSFLERLSGFCEALRKLLGDLFVLLGERMKA